jgi:type IV secretion system protein VirB4
MNAQGNALARDLKFGKERQREMGISAHIPYLRHIDPDTIVTKSGSLIQVIKLGGLPFQTMDQAEVNARFFNRNTMIKALGSSRFALYSTIIRRRIEPEIDGTFDNPFVTELNDRYMESLRAKSMYVNELYVSVIRRPMTGKIGLVDRMFDAFRKVNSGEESRAEAVKDLARFVSGVVGDLASYGTEVLTCVDRPGGKYSEPIEFIAKILSGGEEIEMPLPRMAIAEAVGVRRPFFGRSALEIQGLAIGTAKLGAMLSMKEYPPYATPGMLDGLLRLPYEFIATQSFAIEDRESVREAIEKIARQVAGSDEAGTSVEDDVEAGRDKAASGEVIFGKHHFSLCAFAEDMLSLNKAITDISSELSRMSIVTVREDLNMEAAFWAQLPGNFSYIARSSLISSLNYAGLFSAHNFPSGKTKKLHWGTPIALMETTSQTAYYFNFHVDDVGNFTVMGPTGSGKTVVLSFLMANALRVTPRPRCVFFDKDNGGEIFVTALGGRYETMSPGVPTGFAPLQLDDTPHNRAFAKTLVAYMLKPSDSDLSAEENEVIANAVDDVFSKVPRHERVLECLDEGLRGRLKAGVGDLPGRLREWTDRDNKGWLFNNPTDELDFSQTIIGFDMTQILSDPRTRTAALLYVFHRIQEVLNGDPALIFLDEGWKLLDDPVFTAYIKDMLKTIRKQNGIMGFGTQSAADVVNSSIANTLIEQTQTNIFFPNAKADVSSYREYFGLTAKEFRYIKEADKNSRTFLIKHASDSIIARLDLSKMPDIVKVLSGRTETVREARALRERYGNDPADWLPYFCGWKREGGDA